MNKFIFILSAVCILFFSCNFSGDNSNDYAYYKVAPRTEDSQFSVSGSGLKIDMISVLNTDAIVLGEDVESVTKNVQVVPFSMSKFEVSYNVWRFVYSWATSDLRGNKKYTFENAGAEGQYGDLSSSKLFNEGGEPQDEGIPVCGINWRDAVVWCNALSELCGLAPVYFTDSDFKNPLRNSIYAEGESPSNIPLPYGNAKATDMTSLAKGNVDNPYVNKNADGFRLPYLYEWEYAARKCEDGSFISGRNAPGDKTGPCNGSTKPTLMDEIMGIEFVAQSKVAKKLRLEYEQLNAGRTKQNCRRLGRPQFRVQDSCKRRNENPQAGRKTSFQAWILRPCRKRLRMVLRFWLALRLEIRSLSLQKHETGRLQRVLFIF